jgi:hypothetical protein
VSGRGETDRNAQREDREAQVRLRHGCSRRCSGARSGKAGPHHVRASVFRI